MGARVGGQAATCRSSFYQSTTWVPGFELGHQTGQQNAFPCPVSHLSFAGSSPPVSQRASGLEEPATASETPRNPREAQTCRRGARPRHGTRPRQPRAASRAPEAPPLVTHRGAGPQGSAPTPPIGRRAVTTSREAGRVCVSV